MSIKVSFIPKLSLRLSNCEYDTGRIRRGMTPKLKPVSSSWMVRVRSDSDTLTNSSSTMLMVAAADMDNRWVTASYLIYTLLLPVLICPVKLYWVWPVLPRTSINVIVSTCSSGVKLKGLTSIELTLPSNKESGD